LAAWVNTAVDQYIDLLQWADLNAPASFVSVACAGATTADVLSSQVSALSASTTLVSITIGGNDAGFSSVMETCVLSSTSTCVNAVSNAEAFVTNQLPALLNTTLQTIRADAPNARIVVLSYPDLYDLSKSRGCIGLSTQDRTALNGGADALDSALATAAGKVSDSTFADVRSQFAHHEICDSSSWLNSIDIFAISSSYHPNASGQGQGYLPVFTKAVGQPGGSRDGAADGDERGGGHAHDRSVDRHAALVGVHRQVVAVPDGPGVAHGGQQRARGGQQRALGIRNAAIYGGPPQQGVGPGRFALVIHRPTPEGR